MGSMPKAALAMGGSCFFIYATLLHTLGRPGRGAETKSEQQKVEMTEKTQRDVAE